MASAAARLFFLRGECTGSSSSESSVGATSVASVSASGSLAAFFRPLVEAFSSSGAPALAAAFAAADSGMFMSFSRWSLMFASKSSSSSWCIFTTGGFPLYRFTSITLLMKIFFPPGGGRTDRFVKVRRLVRNTHGVTSTTFAGAMSSVHRTL